MESIEKAPARKDKKEKRKKKAKPRLEKEKGVLTGSKVEREREDGAVHPGEHPAGPGVSTRCFPSGQGSQDRCTGFIHTKSKFPAQPTTARWVSPCACTPVLLSLQPVGLPVGLQS